MSGDSFVGRKEELAVLRDELDKAADERPRVILIDGDPGIGKTSLVREFIDETPHADVLRGIGDATLPRTGYAVLSQFTPGLDGADVGGHLPARSPIQLGGQLLRAIGERQGTRPLCLVIDDAPDADLPSLQALLFVLRRLQADRVMTILLARSDDVQSLPDGFVKLATLSGQRITLSGLSYQSFQLMATERCGQALSTQTLRRLWEFTKGNPLHAIVLLDEYSLDDLDRAGEPLPPPLTFAQSVVRRLERCSPDAQALVAAASVLGRAAALRDVSALVPMADPRVPLEEAVAADLLEPCVPSATVDVRFAHPLIHSTVYHHLPARERSRLHTAAATIASTRDEQLHHRVAAASNPDRGVADECARTRRGAVFAPGLRGGRRSLRGGCTAVAGARRSSRAPLAGRRLLAQRRRHEHGPSPGEQRPGGPRRRVAQLRGRSRSAPRRATSGKPGGCCGQCATRCPGRRRPTTGISFVARPWTSPT